MTPTLTSERLTLSPYRAGMVTQQHVNWLNDPEVVKYSEQRHHKHTIASQHIWLNDFPVRSHVWLITRQGKIGSFDVGSITAYIDEPNLLANMGILLGKGYWGLGYGKEAWKTVMDYLLHHGIRKVECGCAESNIAMRLLAEKTGMNREGIIPHHFVIDGNIDDLYLYGLRWYEK